MNSTQRPKINVNLPVPTPVRRNYGTLKTNETTPPLTSLYSNKSTRKLPPKPGIVLRRQPSNLESQLKQVYNNNSNYSNAESVPLNLFNLKPTLEVPKNLQAYSTPNRPIYSPFGKFGFLPDEPPRRKHTRKVKHRRRHTRRRHRS